VTLFWRLCQLRFTPFLTEKTEKMIPKEIVKSLPIARKMNPLANGHHLMAAAQLRRNNRPSQSLLLRAPGVKGVDLFHAPVEFRITRSGPAHGIGAVTSFIFFPAPAGAGLISSNMRHKIASGVLE
jgi:hypothetical protein